MFRNLLLVCAALLGTVISIFAVRTNESRADFRYVNPSGIHTLDPARISWTQDIRLALNIWEGLTTWDPQTLEPVGAAAYFPPVISSDRLTYEFSIRPDSRWSNGDTVTAGDFVRGWRRGLEPGTATDYTFFLTDNIEGAAEYVRFRRKAMTALSVLSRLQEGWPVSDSLLRTFVQTPIYRDLQQSNNGQISEAPEGHGRASWAEFVRQIREADVDWGNTHEEVLQTHRHDFGTAFDRVGIVARDERTLIVTLKNPCPYFLDLLAMPIFLPVHESIELLRERFDRAPFTREGLVIYNSQWTKPDCHQNGYPGLVTNGPYRLSEWIFKRRARLITNPYHRASETMTTRIVDMLVFENISAALMAYEAGAVDFLPAMSVPYDHEIARLARTGERTDFHLCPVLATYFLNFNCVSADVGGVPNPFVDARVRRAFALAIDKQAIVKRVLARGDRVATSFVPSGAIPGYNPPQGIRRDVDEARRLLRAAGYGRSKEIPPVELLYTPQDERVCQALARMWETSLGVSIRLVSKESKTFAEDKAHHRFMIARGNWYADYIDPTTFLDCLRSGNGNNDSGYSNPVYDALLESANRQADPGVRMKLLRQAEAIVVEQDFPILPILHYAEPLAIKPYVHGLYPNARLWFPFQNVTVNR